MDCEHNYVESHYSNADGVVHRRTYSIFIVTVIHKLCNNFCDHQVYVLYISLLVECVFSR